MAGKGCEGSVLQHPDRAVRACAALDRLPGLGLGHERRRTGAKLPEAFRFGHRPERPYPSGHAEGRGSGRLPHRTLHGVSAGSSRRCQGSRPVRSAARRIEELPGHGPDQPGVNKIAARHCRYALGKLRGKSSMRTTFQRGLLLACLIVPAAARSNDAAQVKIDNFKFGPEKLAVAKGTPVTWTNQDDIPHSIVLTALGVHSEVLDTDKDFTYQFDKAGTFSYICGLHPFMP